MCDEQNNNSRRAVSDWEPSRCRSESVIPEVNPDWAQPELLALWAGYKLYEAFKSRIFRARRQMACELRQSRATVASEYDSQSCREVHAKLGARKLLRSCFATANAVLKVSASRGFQTDMPTTTLRTMEPLALVRSACSLPISLTPEASDGAHETDSRSKTAFQKGGFANGY
jgi:hypothetical protein